MERNPIIESQLLLEEQQRIAGSIKVQTLLASRRKNRKRQLPESLLVVAFGKTWEPS